MIPVTRQSAVRGNRFLFVTTFGSCLLQDYFLGENMNPLPKWHYQPPIGDLFSNFNHNWNTLLPVTGLLFGIIFATWLIAKVIKHVKGSD